MRILCLLTMLVVGETRAQNITPSYSVTYTFTSVRDTLAGQYHRPETYLLLGTDEGSRFLAANDHFNDSMRIAYEVEHPLVPENLSPEELQAAVDEFLAEMNVWLKPHFAKLRVEKDFGAGVARNQLSFAFPPVHLDVPLITDWRTSGEQDTIAGYACYAATTTYGGRRYTAWFTPAVPVNDGPYVFSGLPGLILRVSDDRGWFTFSVTSFTTNPGPRSWPEGFRNPFSRSISRQEFVSRSERQKSNPRISGVESLGEERLLEMKERYRGYHFLLLERL